MQNRLGDMREHLTKHAVDALLVSSLEDIVHLTEFSYFSNSEREAYLLITQNSQYIFTDGRYTHAVKQFLKNFSLQEITTEKPFINHFKDIITQEKITTLGIEEDDLRVHEYKKIISAVKQTKHLSLASLRITKTPEEIAKIKKACAIGDKAFSYILKQIKLGMTELEIAARLEIFIKKQGAEISFPSIVAFEENAAIPHHKTGNKKLTINNLILIDFGVKYNNYCSDMTRTIFFGQATKEQKRVYEIVLQAQHKSIERFNHLSITSKPIKTSELDNLARSYIISKGYPSLPHSLGHGIGLQVHEAPRLSPTSKETLSEGMVFSIEPGIYLQAGRQVSPGFGIRIEDLFAIQNNKLVQLTKSPQKLIEVNGT